MPLVPVPVSLGDFISNPPASTRIGIRPGLNALGEAVTEKVFLDMNTGHFAVQIMNGSEAGALKTFFPKNGGSVEWLDYWNKQNITHVVQ